jgi:hypothetical protein
MVSGNWRWIFCGWAGSKRFVDVEVLEGEGARYAIIAQSEEKRGRRGKLSRGLGGGGENEPCASIA